MVHSDCRFIFKIVYREPDLSSTTIELSDLDKQSGFIHLSTGEQIPQTCHLFFPDFNTLYIIKFSYDKLKTNNIIKWEPPAPDNDQLFPHLYGDLKTADVDHSMRAFRREQGSTWIDVLSKEEWLKS